MSPPTARSADATRLDARSVRRHFDRAAATYDAAAVLHREVGRRMAERLSLIKLQPTTILDAGCGTGEALGELAVRYPEATLIGVDVAFGMVAAARRRAAAMQGLRREPLAPMIDRTASPAATYAFVCGDATRLPLAHGSVDLVWSNLVLQWIGEPLAAFEELLRALRVGGLLMFTTFGPDTLKELRAAFAGVDATTHVSRFVDMHDLGDALVEAGFADPVMDMETITLTYADAHAMMRELKALGAHNATVGRPRGLMGRERYQRVMAALERFRREGRLPATYEVVYGHAWKPEPRFTADGSAIVRFERRS